MSIKNRINFIVANIGDNTKFNTPEARLLFGAKRGDEILVKENNPDLNLAYRMFQQHRKPTDINGVRGLREFEVTVGRETSYYYMMTVRDVLYVRVNGHTFENSSVETIHFLAFHCGPLGADLVQDNNYAEFGQAFGMIESFAPMICGWEWYAAGGYYIFTQR